MYQEHGLHGVMAWIGPDIDPAFKAGNVPDDAYSLPSPSKCSRTNDAPPPPIEEPPPVPPNPSQSGNFLAQFNERAMQKRLTLTWEGSQTGSSHAPVWTMECKGRLGLI